MVPYRDMICGDLCFGFVIDLFRSLLVICGGFAFVFSVGCCLLACFSVYSPNSGDQAAAIDLRDQYASASWRHWELSLGLQGDAFSKQKERTKEKYWVRWHMPLIPALGAETEAVLLSCLTFAGTAV